MQDHLAPGWQSHFDPKASSYPLQLNSSACTQTWSCWIERVRPHSATVINETTKLNFKHYCEMKDGILQKKETEHPPTKKRPTPTLPCMCTENQQMHILVLTTNYHTFLVISSQLWLWVNVKHLCAN